jgi:transketolase
MLIASPGDPMEVRACLRYLVAHPQPSYLRLGKNGEPNFHRDVPDVAPGKWLAVAAAEAAQTGKTLLTTGAPLAYAAEWIKRDAKYRGYALHSLPLWSMAVKPQQAAQVHGWNEVVTVEDHLQDGGFGSWMLEALCRDKQLMSRIELKALSPEVCGMVGKQEALNEAGGLTDQ